MSPDEARIFLKLSEGHDPEDVLDAFEEQVFAIRQFILSKPTLLKTFQQKQQQLLRLQDAFVTLEGSLDSSANSVRAIDLTPLDEVEFHLMQYHQKKNELKQRVAVSLNVGELVTLIDRLIEIERILALPFRDFSEWTADIPVIGRDMDAMQVLRDLREQAGKGRVTVKQLWQHLDEMPGTLLLELKRLSLLQNYLYE